ncbi:MAG: phospholipid carrier-dependent glycosyltransferase, partial [Acetatifactor sp.]|nr:phospholipid carrier-dependent glycosyltransferase [Acetatifactor sp.]
MKRIVFKEKSDRLYFGMLALIFAAAVILRIVGAGWGMPHRNLHPDEGIIFGPAYQCALNRDFEVHDYYRPNHVTIKMNTLLYIGIQELYFAPQGQDDFALNYNENFGLFTTASRVLTALFGVGTVILAYFIGLFWGRKQALFAALLFAVFPSFIEHSHYITPDVPLLFFLMCVLWAALCYQRKPSVSWLFWMSFFTALATCEKYPGAYGCGVIAVAVCATHIKKPVMIVKYGCLAIFFFILGIMAVSPVLLIDFRTVLEAIAGQHQPYHLGADGFNFGEKLLFYFKTTGVHFGLLLTVSSIYGIVKSFRKNVKPTIILLGFLAYIVPISTITLHFERYTLPIYAAGLLFGAVGVFYIAEDIQGFLKIHPLASWIAYPIFFLLPVCSLLAGSIAVCGSFLAPDSRIILQDAFAEMGITGNNTIYDCNTPLDPGGYYGAFSNFEEADPDKFKYGNGPKFIVTSSAQRDLYLEADPEVYGWIAKFYERLDERYDLICLYTVETPSCHFLELQNIWYAARSVYRYMGFLL